MQKLATNSMGVTLEPAPVCKFSPDGSQILMGDFTKPFVQGGEKVEKNDGKIFERSLKAGASDSANEGLNLNTVLLYNCAAMSYQTQ